MSYEYVEVINRFTMIFSNEFRVTNRGLPTIYITFSNGFLGYDYYVYKMVPMDLSMSFG